MEWIKAIAELIGSFAWPATALVLVILFRREIRQRLEAVREVKYPGGSISMQEVERLRASVEKNEPPQLPEDIDTLSLPFEDPKLVIAQGRIDVERELFRLSWRTLGLSKVTNWQTTRHVDELESAKIITRHFAQNLREFFDVANRVLHGTDVPAGVVARTAAIAGDLLATVRYKRLVHEADKAFKGLRFWRKGDRLSPQRQRYHIMSIVAAHMPEFGYNYNVYKDAVELFNARQRSDRPLAPGGEIPLLTLGEFIETLEFRESELERVHRELLKANWDDKAGINSWRWPDEWGDLGWSCPVLRERVNRVSTFNAEQELMQTRASLERHRARIRGRDSMTDSARNNAPKADGFAARLA